MTIDYVDSIPIIDTHVHRFHPKRAGEFCTIAGGFLKGPEQEKHARQTILYHMAIEELRRFFGMPADATDEEVERERNRRFNDDFYVYSRSLYAECNTSMYCIETGSPMGGPRYTDKEVNEFHLVIPDKKVCEVIRIDRVISDVFNKNLAFSEFKDQFHIELNKRIMSGKTVGLKSCSAFYGGLDIQAVSDSEMEISWDKLRRNPEDSFAVKRLQNYFVFESLREAEEYNLPIQFHTGSGGGPFLDFRTENPVNMIDFLKDKRVHNRVKIVLLHAGHPYSAETGYLVSQFSNVYTDFSGTFYLSSIGFKNTLTSLMEKAPMDKIMYGSDGVGMPEFSWMAEKIIRKRLPAFFCDWVNDGYITQLWAKEVVRKILHDNALECYQNIGKYLV